VLGLKQLPLLIGLRLRSRCGWNRTTMVELMKLASSKERSDCGGTSCTCDLRRMRPTSYYCSTPRCPRRDSNPHDARKELVGKRASLQRPCERCPVHPQP
jgi:hypothetical protein